MDYKEAYLWKMSLDNNEYGHDEKRNKLKKVFYRARENAETILNIIRNDFPSLTVHDITHVDSLWYVGSVIVGEEYKINPLEGFVLGCAFLMHDAVLSYKAAGGIDKLRNTIEWKDYYVDYKKRKDFTEEECLYETDFNTIRFLHAKYAEELYKQLFEREDGSRFYIIEDDTMRIHLGEIICKIAASHHWDIDDIEGLGNQLPALSDFPREWRINPLKLACILRCADAGHIDAGRAPDYLLKLLEINGVSRNHWIAQNRLMQIDVDINDENKVIFKSNIKFKEDEFAAWNVAFDAVRVLDHELKMSNEILKGNNTQEFKAKGVTGAETQENLCKYIETEGWIPCDTNVHISNTEDLIRNLGGEKLYGSEHKLEIVLRELIQNGRDAIEARRKMEVDYEGGITILIEKEKDTIWVTVADDGIGMSINVIRDYLLNFGSSFWASDLAKREYPGLNASGFKSVGKFGIGFYSIFMVAAEVIVETRKYDKGFDDTYVVKFPKGFCLRPIISKKRSLSSRDSTIIRFSIDESKYRWNEKVIINPAILGEEIFEVPYSAVLSNLTAGLDVDVYYSEFKQNIKKVHTNIDKLELGSFELVEWLKAITYANYRGGTVYSDYIEENYTRLRKIYVNKECYGIAALNTLWESNASFFAIRTIGGLSTSNQYYNDEDFLGCIIGETNTAKRDCDINSIDRTEWAREQYAILCEEGLSTNDRLRLPYTLGKYAIDMTEEMMVHIINKRRGVVTISLKEFLIYLKKSKEKLILALSNFSEEKRLENYLDYERTVQKMEDREWLYVVETNSSYLSVKEDDEFFKFNVINCIHTLGQRYSMQITYQQEQNKAVSRMGGECSAIVITVK